MLFIHLFVCQLSGWSICEEVAHHRACERCPEIITARKTSLSQHAQLWSLLNARFRRHCKSTILRNLHTTKLNKLNKNEKTTSYDDVTD